MVDKISPTNQFHPYQPTDAIPHRDMPSGGLSSMMKRIGLGRGSLASARGVAQKNPGVVLGGLAALVIGAGLMRRRGMSR